MADVNELEHERDRMARRALGPAPGSYVTCRRPVEDAHPDVWDPYCMLPRGHDGPCRLEPLGAEGAEVRESAAHLRRLAALEAENERLRVALGRIAALDDESTGNIRGTIAREALGGEGRE